MFSYFLGLGPGVPLSPLALVPIHPMAFGPLGLLGYSSAMEHVSLFKWRYGYRHLPLVENLSISREPIPSTDLTASKGAAPRWILAAGRLAHQSRDHYGSLGITRDP